MTAKVSRARGKSSKLAAVERQSTHAKLPNSSNKGIPSEPTASDGHTRATNTLLKTGVVSQRSTITNTNYQSTG